MLKPSGSKKEKKMVGRNSRSFIECIPEEVLFAILLRLLAHDIYFGARLVCRKWYDMVSSRNFIREHLERASSGILCRDESGDFVSIFAGEDGGLYAYNLNYKFTYKHKDRYPVWSSWNGLMLVCEGMFGKNLTYHVTNNLTDQVFRLPQCPYFVPSYGYSGFGYDATSMAYKVVVTCESSEGYLCGVLTLGVDKSWRIVRTDHLSDLGKFALTSSPINTEGFVHWKKRYGSFVTLNLKTEILSEPPPPPVLLKHDSKIHYLPTRRCISLFVRKSLVWEVYEMKPEIGEWTKLSNICLEGIKGKIESLVGFNLRHDGVGVEPWGWLKYPEVLAVRIQYTFIISYNVITCEIGDKKLPTLFNCFQVTPYKNSLVRLGES